MDSPCIMEHLPANNAADFVFWSRAEIWNYKEAVLLSVGLDPRHFDLSERYSEPYEPYDIPSGDLKREVIARLALVRRAISNPKGALERSGPPYDYVSWLQAKGFSLPKPLTQITREHDDLPNTPTPSPSVAAPSRIEQKTIAGLVLMLLDQSKTLKYLNGNKINVSAIARDFEAQTMQPDGSSWAGARERAVHQAITNSLGHLDPAVLQSAIDRRKKR